MQPYIQIGAVKIAPFKNPKSKPYGAFSNSTLAWDYPIKESLKVHAESLQFNWPSSEHTFHAQKIIHLKEKLEAHDPRQAILTKTLHQLEHTKNHPKEEFFPHSDYERLIKNMINNNPELDFGRTPEEFDTLCDAIYPNKNHSKQGLTPNGKPYLLEFMRHTLKMKFEQNEELKQLAIGCAREDIIPVEVSHLDNYWGSGPDGLGQNKLGLIIFELGNDYLKNKDKLS